MARYLSKSDFKIAQTCPTKLFYKKSGYPTVLDDDDYLTMLADGGFMVEKIAKLLYPEGTEIGFDTDPEFAAQETLNALSAESVTLFEATLISNGKFARVDILKKVGCEFHIIEVKAKSYDSDENKMAKLDGRPNLFRTKKGNRIVSGWEEYLQDVTFQVLVLKELFPKAVIRPFLMMPDKAKTTSIDQLHSFFRIKRSQRLESKFQRVEVEFSGDLNPLQKDHFLTLVPVGTEVNELLPEVERKTAIYLESLNPELRKITVPLTIACRGCEYRASAEDHRDGFKDCWGKLADVAPHVFELYHIGTVGGRGGRVVNALIQQGKVGLLDLPRRRLVKSDGTIGARNKRQIVQIDHTAKNTEWISRAFPKILRSFEYPLHFIDFETTAIAIPYHAGMHPYEQVAFQWSCHKLTSPGSRLEHSEWINTTDVFPNFQFATSLMECVGDHGTIFMWATHENTILTTVLRQMGSRKFEDPKLREWIRSVVRLGPANPGRLVDMNRLTEQHYFHPLMKGRTSIKIVCDAIWKMNPVLRRSFPEYVMEKGGEILSPYASLPPLEIAGTQVAVAEGTGAIRAYEAMLYGLEKNDEQTKDNWKRLLLQYCKLDSLSMVMIWQHWTDLVRSRTLQLKLHGQYQA